MSRFSPVSLIFTWRTELLEGDEVVRVSRTGGAAAGGSGEAASGARGEAGIARMWGVE
jgi:hypothetical protein